ncbi:MAG: hypothetical protein ACRCXZ_07125 [Patescibacteria group bacterium]
MLKQIKKNKKYLVTGLSILLLSLMGFGVYNYNQVTKYNVLPEVTSENCNTKPAFEFEKTTLEQNKYLKKLNDFQIICNSMAFDKMMIFTYLPQSDEEIRSESKILSAKLLAFNRYNIKPIIVFEPAFESGYLNFKKIAEGEYNSSLRNYFEALVKEGMTTENIGQIIPFPEPNIPVWNRKDSEPETFAKAFNNFVEILREYIPNQKAIPLLNTKTYNQDDKDWAKGSIQSLKPWVKDIKEDYIGKVGLQGFPWQSAKNERQVFETSIEKFLPIKSIEELIETTNNNTIMLNTGTYGSKYTQDKNKTVIFQPKDRKKILDEIQLLTYNLQKKGNKVAINIFAEDKSDVAEDTDWSYKTADEVRFLKEFIARSELMNIELSVYNK